MCSPGRGREHASSCRCNFRWTGTRLSREQGWTGTGLSPEQCSTVNSVRRKRGIPDFAVWPRNFFRRASRAEFVLFYMILPNSLKNNNSWHKGNLAKILFLWTGTRRKVEQCSPEQWQNSEHHDALTSALHSEHAKREQGGEQWTDFALACVHCSRLVITM